MCNSTHGCYMEEGGREEVKGGQNEGVRRGREPGSARYGLVQIRGRDMCRRSKCKEGEKRGRKKRGRVDTEGKK